MAAAPAPLTTILTSAMFLPATSSAFNSEVYKNNEMVQMFSDETAMLFEKVIPAEEKFTKDDVYELTKLACLEYFSSGITTVMEMYYFPDMLRKAFLDMNMRAVIQRVSHASVTIDEQIKSQIEQGYLILLGICEEDSMEDVDWLVKKIANLRVFGDENDVMNRSILDVGGNCLVVSQFTLYASYKKGNRPSWFRAGSHEHSIPLYQAFCSQLSEATGKTVGTGEFGADMKVELLNDGPVTICMDTKNKE